MAHLHGAQSVCLFEFGRICVWSRSLFAECYDCEKVEGETMVDKGRSSEEGTSKNSHIRIKDKR